MPGRCEGGRGTGVRVLSEHSAWEIAGDDAAASRKAARFDGDLYLLGDIDLVEVGDIAAVRLPSVLDDDAASRSGK